MQRDAIRAAILFGFPLGNASIDDPLVAWRRFCALQTSKQSSMTRRLEDSIEAVERVLEQVHDLSLNLRPSMLDDLGLEPALRDRLMAREAEYTRRIEALRDAMGIATRAGATP